VHQLIFSKQLKYLLSDECVTKLPQVHRKTDKNKSYSLTQLF
jgi:hypothetical protein